jgi:hypothetical protein
MGTKFGLEDQVTALLMDDAVAPIAAQRFGEITAFEVPRQCRIVNVQLQFQLWA